MNTTLANETEILIRADAGGEPGVIFNSAVALLQGLFPPTVNYNTTLANGTTVTGPLGGYQTVPSELSHSLLWYFSYAISSQLCG